MASSLLPPERAALGQAGLATGGLAQDLRAALANDNGLGVREDGGDGEAAGALDVHEEGAGAGHKGLGSGSAGAQRAGGLDCTNLELVLAGLGRGSGVEKVNGENLHAKKSQHQALASCSRRIAAKGPNGLKLAKSRADDSV